ncbi:peptidase [Streptomyces olivoreticuli]|uniref:trypsin-like serine peptidase n=1 Tax=Streptomyces olivoreticuli TaxID=68246 RepID=UPI00265964EC|nr:trypsin-like peptidase domain-containing protein [Streptomyces olivoreticuli]WKK23635.1 peptidase [Streptomyces olivoreticuli]
MRASKPLGRLSAVALACAVALGAAPPPATAAAPATAEVTYTAKERQEALAYWTAARMRKVSESVDLGPTGPLTKEWKGAPVKTVGRLFFVNANGDDTWCTATAVRSGNRSVVLAAGHCVRRGASPANTHMDLVFVPGYAKSAQTPHGVFPVRATVTPASWAQDARTDVAALTVDPVGGKRLTDAVGGQQVAFDREPGGQVTAFGYPATRPQRGEKLLSCTGPATAAPDDELRMPCDMTGGASGGPWLADFDTKSGLGTLVSVNSHGDALEHSTAMFGPVLGAAARAVHERAQRL